MPNFKLRNKGFTLVELMVTITILSILMTIAIVSYGNVQRNARDGKRKSDISVIQSALEQYHADAGYYPASITFNSSLNYGTKTYMPKVPQDPQSTYYYGYTATGCTTNCTNYCLFAPLENNSNTVTATNCSTIAPAQSYQTQAP